MNSQPCSLSQLISHFFRFNLSNPHLSVFNTSVLSSYPFFRTPEKRSFRSFRQCKAYLLTSSYGHFATVSNQYFLITMCYFLISYKKDKPKIFLINFLHSFVRYIILFSLSYHLMQVK